MGSNHARYSDCFDATRRREQVRSPVDGVANVIVRVRAQFRQLPLDGLDRRRVGPTRAGQFAHLVCEVGESLGTLRLERELRSEQ